MKIGILTTHAVVNYGSILQAYALQSTLEEMGHQVVIIDKWMSPRNDQLSFHLSDFSIPSVLCLLVHGCLGLGDFGVLARKVKTRKAIASLLKLTPYHFYKWEDAPESIGLDLVIVGSDQVWNTTTLDPSAYLMIGAPNVPTIAYAASFGIPTLPEAWKDTFKKNLSKFSAIAVREKEGCEILQEINIASTHVIDPSLLAAPSIWNSIVSPKSAKRKKLVCYLITPGILTDELLDNLESFARCNDVEVELIGADPQPFRRSIGFCVKSLYKMLRRQFGKVQISRSATPIDFVNAISSATWVLTDSFHAVMFSYIFDRNVRFVHTNHPIREKMFARVNEFAHQYITGQAIADSVSDALKSFTNNETISYNREAVNAFRQTSMAWLKRQLIALHFDHDMPSLEIQEQNEKRI